MANTLPGPSYRNSRHFMIRNTHVSALHGGRGEATAAGSWHQLRMSWFAARAAGIPTHYTQPTQLATAQHSPYARPPKPKQPSTFASYGAPPQDQWRKNQEYNKRTGKPQVPLGTLVRPWATQYLNNLRDYKPADWPPGSSDYIKRRASKQC